jgi:hypothetical protein
VRIVLDTNVVLSALLWRGTPYRLLEAIRQRERLALFTSAALVEELAEVLLRPIPMRCLAFIGPCAPAPNEDQKVVTTVLDGIIVKHQTKRSSKISTANQDTSHRQHVARAGDAPLTRPRRADIPGYAC